MNISVSLSSSLLAALLFLATGCARPGDSNTSADRSADETSRQRVDSAAPGQPLKKSGDGGEGRDTAPVDGSTSSSNPGTTTAPYNGMPSEAPLPSSTASGSSGPASNPSDQPVSIPSGAPSSAPLRPEELPSAGGSGPGPAPSTPTTDEQVAMIRAILASRRGLENVVPSAGTDGCIALTGNVPTAAKKNEATALAQGVTGVRCVTDRLDVR